MMKNCETIRELLLTDYLDNELDSEARAEVEAHLLQCPACRKEFDLIQQTLVVPPEDLKPVQPRRDLWPQLEKTIKARLAAEQAKATKAPHPEPGPGRSDTPPVRQRNRKPLFLFLFLCFALIGGYFYLRSASMCPLDTGHDASDYDFRWTSTEENNYEELLHQKPAQDLIKEVALSPLQLEHLENYRQAHQQNTSLLISRFKTLRQEIVFLSSDAHPSKEVLATRQQERQEVLQTLNETRRQGMLRIKEILSPEQRQALHHYFKTRSQAMPAKGP